MEALKANELRTENLLMHDGEVVVIDSIQQSLLSVKGNNYWELMKDFEPIPLTEDWLIRLGFEKTSNNEHTKDRFVFRKQQHDLVINGFEYDYNGILLTRPEYVHTLQNLYFALMGEELTLKNYLLTNDFK
jgi:hypothetical protein